MSFWDSLRRSAGRPQTVDGTRTDGRRQEAELRRRIADLDSIAPKRPSLQALTRGESTVKRTRRESQWSTGRASTMVVGAVVIIAALVLGQRLAVSPATGPGGSLPAATVTTAVPSSLASGTRGSDRLTRIGSAHLVSAAWSPDSQHASVQMQAVDALTPTVQRIMDRSARTIKSITADGLVWTSANSYRVSRVDKAQNRLETSGQLGSTVETNANAVAAPASNSCVVPPPDIALTCSSDGTEVAALKVTKEDITNAGWLEIVDAASHKVVHEFRDANTNDRAWVSISPDGQSIGFADANGSIWIADGLTGKTTKVVDHRITDTSVFPAWLPDGRLLVPDVQAQVIRVFSADGISSTGDFPYAPMLSVSKSANVIAMANNSTIVTLAPSGRDRVTLDLQCIPNGPGSVYWSPDGTEAIVVCSQTQPDALGDYNESAVLIAAS